MQDLQASIAWKEYIQRPTNLLSNGKTILINGKVYSGGGWTDDYDNDSVV